VSLSAAIYLSPSRKFPVYQAAESAGISLDRAKDDGRNRLSFFDQSVPWNQLPKVREAKGQIVKLISSCGIPRALLSILYSTAEERKLFKEKKISIFRIWRLFYAFRRLKERYRGQIEEIDKLEKIIVTEWDLIPYLDISTRWADYLTRKEA